MIDGVWRSISRFRQDIEANQFKLPGMFNSNDALWRLAPLNRIRSRLDYRPARPCVTLV